MTILSEVIAQARATSPFEVVAVLTAIGYLLLAIRQNILCWPLAGISTAIYIYLYFDARLYMESVLNLFYFGMAIYGWIVWNRGAGEDKDLPVSVWSLKTHAIAITAIAALVLVNGWMLDRWTDAAFPWIDSATTWAAIWATFLVARKVFENWWYWLIIDAVSVVIFWWRDLKFTAILFAVYLIMIPFGMIAWRRTLVEQATR